MSYLSCVDIRFARVSFTYSNCSFSGAKARPHREAGTKGGGELVSPRTGLPSRFLIIGFLRRAPDAVRPQEGVLPRMNPTPGGSVNHRISAYYGDALRYELIRCM